MNTYYPIIYNPNANQLQELPQYSELNLSENSIAIGTFFDSNRDTGLIGQYLAVDTGGVVWTSVPPTAQSGGISIFENGSLVGAAFSFNQINFLGSLVGVESSTSPLNTALITIRGQWNQNSLGLSTTSNVGIGSTQPTVELDIIGNAQVSGILTASEFFGTFTGIANTSTDITISAINSSDTTTSLVLVANQATGGQAPFIDGGLTYNANTNTLSASIFSGDISATNASITNLSVGFSTFSSIADFNSDIDVDGHTELDNVNISGIVTFANNIDANGNLDVDGTTDLDVLNVAETATFSGNIDANGDIDVDGHTELDNLNVTGIASFTNLIQPSFGNNTDKGIEWINNPGGGTGDRAFIKYFADGGGENTRLLIGIEGDSDDDLRLQATNSTFSGGLTVESTTQSTNKDTGSLIVQGGVGVEKNLNVGGNIDVDGVADLDGASIVGIATISTLRAATSENSNLTGVTTATSLRVTGVATVTSLEATNTNLTGVTTVGFITASNLSVSGVVTSSSAVVGSAVTINSSGIDATGTVTATSFVGNGVNLTGIVTQIAAGIGINLTSSQTDGKGVVTVDSYFPRGKTVFVSQNGSDTNTGLTEDDAKKTIKAAASIAFPGDTIKVYPGVYVENNPIVLSRTVSVEGTELRNCVVTPRYLNRDLFHVNNGCHITDLSFVGDAMTDGASIVALQPLLGVATDRFFDAARMIRLNLDYIASETVGYLTSTNYKNPAFTVVDSAGIATDPVNCRDDIKDIWQCVIHDITRGGNSKCVGAGQSYYNGNTLLHITGNDPNGYSVKQATIDAIDYSFNVARAIINNSTWGGSPVGVTSAVSNAVYDGTSGITTITAADHGLAINDAVEIVGLAFTCPSPSGVTTSIFPDGTYGSIFNVKRVIDSNNFEVVVGTSTITHTYDTGGTVQKYENYTHDFTQVKDLSIQNDPDTGFNNAINGCANVVSALHSCIGVVTTIVGFGSTAGITTSYPGNRGYGFSSNRSITTAAYDNTTGITTLSLSSGYSLKTGDIVELRDLVFSCDSGAGVGTTTQKFPSGKYGYEFYVSKVNNDGTVDINVGVSTLEHTYVSGGFMIDRSLGVTTAAYDGVSGVTTVKAPGTTVRVGDIVTLRDLEFTCTSGAATTTIYPTGNNGYDFKVLSVVGNTFHTATDADYDPVSGITTITVPSHGFSTGDRIIVKDRSLIFTCSSDGNTKEFAYPRYTDPISNVILPISNVTANTFEINAGASPVGQQFAHTFVKSRANGIENVVGQFTVNTGVSTIAHDYVSGGVVLPSYSRGVGPIVQGPYVRNCTNFVPGSIGMKIDGFAAEPGQNDDIGVTGTMSVDSYTQYNQGGIGVSITNGAYAQLVSIFTICDDIAIFTGGGGQCDITNSNSSFGRLGLVANGVGDANSKSIYRSTGIAVTDVAQKGNVMAVSGVGSYRPYDGQVCYFGDLYYFVDTIEIDNGGSGYTAAPKVTIQDPSGPNGITAQASSTIDAFGRVTAINLVNSGTQYSSTPPTVTIDPPTGVGVTATASVTGLQPIYYKVDSATLPVAGISTITFLQTLNNTVSAGTTVYFTRVSLQITSSHSFEWVGSGNDINTAKPALGGVVIPENEVVQEDGGIVVYTSTDQAGNFRIGDGVVINQATGQIGGRDFTKALFTTMTPFILALSD